jgi:thioredoxin-like negative regulator of GroEL
MAIRMSIPTLIVFKEGREVTRMIGVRDRDELLQKLDSVT